MVQMGVSEEYMLDAAYLGQRQIAYAGARVDKAIVINAQCGGTEPRSNATAAAQHLYSHAACLAHRTATKPGTGGFTRRLRLCDDGTALSTFHQAGM